MKLANSLVALLPLALCGCPVPIIRSNATFKDKDLPNDVAELIKVADGILAKANATPDGGSTEMENALVALDKAHKLDPKNYEAAWKAARASTWLADELYDEKQKRAHFSGRGVEYAKAAVELSPNGVEGRYYSGANQGLSATTKIVGAKFDVPHVRDAFKKAMQIDPRFDHGGPPRGLGALYAKAPPWPASIGDPDKGVEFLMQAVAIAPSYPLNNLFLADALVAAERYEEAKKQYQIVLDAQPTPDFAHSLSKWQRLARRGIADAEKKRLSSSSG